MDHWERFAVNQIFILGRPRQIPDWGDYGDILRHGMTSHLPRAGDHLQLERTGPFIPPVTFPGISDVVVTDMARRKIAGILPNLRFRSLVKTHIVKSNWDQWNHTAREPAQYPESGEPEDYILAEPHDSLVAERLGELWELVPDIVVGIQGKDGAIQMTQYRGQDFVRETLSAGYNFVSGRLRDALEAIAPDDVMLTLARRTE